MSLDRINCNSLFKEELLRFIDQHLCDGEMIEAARSLFIFF